MKSYFNVPDHINNTNRHLGIKKNIRKNKYEPKAKKKHRIARLKFLNNKRNIEIFQLSLNATYEHIEVLNQHYYNLKTLEVERIRNIELEKQKMLQEVELQKQRDIDNFNNNVIVMKQQLDLIPKYNVYLQEVIKENKIIEEEKLMMEQLIKSERNKKLINIYQNYFHEIKVKRENNTKLLQDLAKQKEQQHLYKQYINKQNQYYDRCNSIYNKAISINSNIINDKLHMQNLLDKWSDSIDIYNDYVEQKSSIIANYQKEQELLDHEEKINYFKNQFTTLNTQVSEIIKNINQNNNLIDELNNESEEEIPEVNDVQFNETYIKHFNTALKNMQSLQKIRIDKINQLKLIEKQQREMIARQEAKKQLEFNETVSNYKNFVEQSRKHRELLIQKQENYMKRQEEIAKHKEKTSLENKAIKLKNDIDKFNKSINLYNNKRDEYIKFKSDEQLKIKVEKEKKFIELERQKKRDSEYRRQVEYIQIIEKTVQNVYTKQIQEIEENYKIYQDEIIRLEEEKEKEQLIEKQKLQKLIDKQNLQQQTFINLEKEYNNILINQQKKLEEEKRQNVIREKNNSDILNNFDQQLTRIHTIKLLKAQEDLRKREDEIRQQELIEYEKNLVFDNNIKYYTNLLVENQKSHELFQKSIREYKEKEIAKLENIKKLKKYEDNKNIINYSIDFILDNVDIKIENIEFNRTINSFDNEINKFHENVISRKKELESINQKQLDDIEYEKIQIKLYEEEMLRYKKDQEKILISQMNDMLLRFNINTQEHIKYIENQKRTVELFDIKKKEQEEENRKLIKQKQQLNLENTTVYYKNTLNEYNENIIKYNNSIVEAKKKIEDEKREYQLQLKREEERIIKLKEEEKRATINNFNSSIQNYRNNINILEKKKIENEKAIIKEKKRLEEKGILEQKKIHDIYINHFTESIEITKKAYEDNIKNQEIAKIKYEEEQKKISENIEIQKNSQFKKLTNEYTSKLDLINKIKDNITKNKAEKKHLLEEQQKLFLKSLEKEKQLKMEEIINDYKSKVDYIEKRKSDLAKKKADKKRFLEEQEKLKNLQQEERKIDEYNKLITHFRNEINEIDKENHENNIKKELARKEYEKQQKELLLKKEQDGLNKYNKLVLSFQNDIENIEETREKILIDKKLTEEEYEKQQRELLLKQKEQLIKEEKAKIDNYNNLMSSFQNEISSLDKEYQQNLINKKHTEEEYKKQQEALLLQQEQEKKDAFNELISNFNDKIISIKQTYDNIKNLEKTKQKNIELKKEEKRLEEIKQQENIFLDLENQYSKSNNDINNSMKNYKKQLDEYNDEQEKILKEQEFKIEEENRLKRQKYQETIQHYEKKIKDFQDEVRERKDNIEKIKLLKKIEEQKNIEENDREKIKLQKDVINNYQEEIKTFYDNQNKFMNQLYEELKHEKEIEHKNRMLKLEEDISDKMNSIDKDDVLKKIDNTINYIKDLNENKENTDFINKLKQQYDNSYINPDDEVVVDNKDIISVGDNKLLYDNFSIYNRFTFNVVPKIIYQTWPTKNLTKNMGWVVNRLRTTHSDFEYHLFDDNDCRNFIKKHFGMETLWCFDRLIPGAFKADLWRYCVMYITGGIYLDIKMCPVNGFRFNYLLKNDWFCQDLARGDGFAGIWQGILVSRPRNPVFKYLISEVIKNVKDEYYGDDPLDITGPKMMKRLLIQLKIRVNNPLHIKKYLNKKASTISKREYKVGICIDDTDCLLEYDEYRKECLRTGVHYNEAWKKNQVYNKSVLLENYLSQTV